MTITTKFSLTWHEYYAAWYFLKRHSSDIAPEKIGGVALMLIGITIWMFGGHALFATCGIIAGLLTLIGVPWQRRAEFKRRWANEPFHHTEHEVSFSSEGIHYVQGLTESNLHWGFYERGLESADGFLLICGEDVFSLIPKRAFESAETLSNFRALLAQKLRKRA